MNDQERWILNYEAREDLKSFAYEHLEGDERNLILDISHYCRFIDGVPREQWPSFLEYRILKRENPGYTTGGSLYDSWQETLVKRGIL